MKKYNSKILTLCSLVFGTFVLTSFFSCDGVIFDTIRDEVELDDAEISGDIQSIIRYTLDGVEHIFVSTGEIYHRSVATNVNRNGEEVEDFADSVANSKIDWDSFSTPRGFVYSLAADSTNLYAASVVIEEDDDGYNVGTERNLYCYDGSKWNKIWTASYSSSNAAILFCTNSPKPENREAYFRYGKKIWKLSGTTELSDDSAQYVYKASATDSSGNALSSIGTELSAEDENSTAINVTSCAKLGGTTYFSSAYAMTTNESPDSDATYIYYSSGDNVYYSNDGSTWTAVDLSCDTIYSLGVTYDYLLAGTDSGIVHTTWASENIPSAGNSDFDTNADSTLSSYYEIPAILVIDSSRHETTGTIYASSVTSSSSASLNNVGLWSYYASEGEWNRE